MVKKMIEESAVTCELPLGSWQASKPERNSWSDYYCMIQVVKW